MMNTPKAFSVAAGLLLAASISAHSADLGGPKGNQQSQVEPALSHRSINCYVDAGASLGVAVSDIKDDAGFKLPVSPNGLTAQLGGGCDTAPMHRFVLGLYGLYNLGEIKTTFNVGEDARADFNLSKSYSLGGRVGYMIQPTTMLYGRLGYAAARAEFSSGTDKLERDLTGILAGVGVETLLFGPLSLRLGVDHYHWKNLQLDETTRMTGGMWTGTSSLVFKF
jgi:opacity protein-like surface antigen